MSWFTIVLICILLVVLVLFPSGPWSRNRSARTRYSASGVYRNDDSCWHGPIYNNPNDPDLFVPKRFGLGWTINFGHPLGKVVLLGPLLLPLVMMLLQLLVTGSITPVGCHPSTGCHLFP